MHGKRAARVIDGGCYARKRKGMARIPHIIVTDADGISTEYKFCTKCEQLLLPDNFSDNINSWDGKTSFCRSCVATLLKGNYKRKQWRKKNPECTDDDMPADIRKEDKKEIKVHTLESLEWQIWLQFETLDYTLVDGLQ